jgi:hypothetical protein
MLPFQLAELADLGATAGAAMHAKNGPGPPGAAKRPQRFPQ